ncbi:conserved hypothetical protein [Micrococcus sp. 116]|nr:conserved hypothetical protein [Micrococcus sp. 116]
MENVGAIVTVALLDPDPAGA